MRLICISVLPDTGREQMKLSYSQSSIKFFRFVADKKNRKFLGKTSDTLST